MTVLSSLVSEGAAGPDTVPLTPILRSSFGSWFAGQPSRVKNWLRSTRFSADDGSVIGIPDEVGALQRVIAVLTDDEDVWQWAALPPRLPPRTYRIDVPLSQSTAGTSAALGWALETYRFARYRGAAGRCTTLVWPQGCDRAAVERAATAIYLARDLINTPACDMGPAQLADAIADAGNRFGADVQVLTGNQLLVENYPAIHAVGQASPRAPRLIDMRWGNRHGPRVTIVGKGVCFDTGGLDVKPTAAMKLMKKDMGGAAIALALAQMIMAADLPVSLRLLVPAVENSISGASYRPLDVVRTRKGTTVEIGNTDAEGRVILADALFEASRERPELLVDIATLTGAARVALGTELPALFGTSDEIVDALVRTARRTRDPLWPLPLWVPYRRHIEGKVAELTNAPAIAYAGAITAALFLKEFVEETVPWLHVDVMAWNTERLPGRPEGGEAMGLRALYAFVEERFGG